MDSDFMDDDLMDDDLIDDDLMDDESTVHIDYIFLTIKSQGLRIAVGNQKDLPSIVYTYDMDLKPEDSFYSYRVYLNALTEEEGKVLQTLVETKHTRKAHNYLLQTMKRDKMIGPYGPVVMSDFIPDEWFEGCKDVLTLLENPQIKGIFPMDFDIMM